MVCMESAAPPGVDLRVAAVRARLTDLTGPVPDPTELAMVIRLLRSFTARTPAAAEVLIDLLSTDDAGRVRDQAHALKGSAANLGATALAAVCATVESRARDGVVCDPAATAAELRSEVAGALRAMDVLTTEYQRHLLSRRTM
jgi:histidine phosphotransfer protein HptB